MSVKDLINYLEDNIKYIKWCSNPIQDDEEIITIYGKYKKIDIKVDFCKSLLDKESYLKYQVREICRLVGLKYFKKQEVLNE